MAYTPAVAHASAVRSVTGAMISASHNAFGDNGIKFFAPGGRKLSDEVEEALEAELDRILHEHGAYRRAEDPTVGAAWVDAVVASVPDRGLGGYGW